MAGPSDDPSDNRIPKGAPNTRLKPWLFGVALVGAFGVGVVVTRGLSSAKTLSAPTESASAAAAPSTAIEAPGPSQEAPSQSKTFSLSTKEKTVSAIVLPDVRLVEQFVEEHAAVWEDDLDLAPADEGDLVATGVKITPRYPADGERIDRPALAKAITGALAANTADAPVVPVPLEPAPPRRSRAELDQALTVAESIVAAPIELVAEGKIARKLIVKPEVLARALRTEPTDTGFDVRLEPRELKSTIAKVEKEWGHRAEDARFETTRDGGIRIVPSKNGTRIDLARVAQVLKDAATTKERRAALPIGEAQSPEFTTADAEALRIKGLVATFTTRFPPRKPRVKNIERIAELVDGAIVPPGETFSLNRAAGPRSKERGFVLAPSIGDGEIRDTWGGGVSQFATTLYNAVFDAGYVILDHKPHRYWFDRYPMGIEATLSWPKPDLVFRNDTKAGLLIRTVMTDGTVTVLLYGDIEGRRGERKVGQPYAFEEPKTELHGDTRLDVDDEEVKEPGSRGFTVDVSRIIRTMQGKPKEEKRTVKYRARPRILKVHPCKVPRGGKGYTGRPCPTSESDHAQ